MRTATYLRLSLLIPILVWVLCLPIFIFGGKLLEMNDLPFNEALDVGYIPILFIAFYLFGIIVWIFPYLLLSLILFFSTFIGKASTLIKVFALSPLAMTILTLATLNIMMLGTGGESTMFSNPGIFDQDFIGLNLLSAAFTLAWGYICVGIGYGIYRILQRRGFMKEEVPSLSVSPIQESS